MAAQTNDSWETDAFIDGSSVEVGNKHQEKMSTFAITYEKQLLDIEGVLEESLSNGWDANLDPVTLIFTPYEQTSIIDLVKTMNPTFTKVTIAFASLCEEIAIMKQTAETVYYPALVLFGEVRNDVPLEGDSQVQLGRMFPFLNDLAHFVERGYEVVKNMVRQLANLYNTELKEHKNLRFATMWKYLSLLFEVFITLDSIITNSPNLKDSWGRYKRMIQTIKKEPTTFGVPAEQNLYQFEKVMQWIKGLVLDSKIFQNAISPEIMKFDEPGKFKVVDNDTFKKIFIATLKEYQQDLENAKQEGTMGKRYLWLSSLLALYVNLFQDTAEKKLLKILWDYNRAIPIVHLYANVTWDSVEFFQTTVPKLVKATGIKEKPEIKKREHLQNLIKAFPSEVRAYYLQVSKWIVEFESNPQNLKVHTNIGLLIRGLGCAQGVSNLLKRYLYLHLTLGYPISAQSLPIIFQCIEILKGIKAAYHRRLPLVAESVAYNTKRTAASIQYLLQPIANKLEGVVGKNISHAKLDARAAVNLSIQMMNGPPTKARSIVFKLAYHQIPSNLIQQEESIAIKIAQLDTLANLGVYIDEATDCSLLYWAPEFLKSYFQQIYNNPKTAKKLLYVFAALRDIIPTFYKAMHISPSELLTSYKEELDNIVKNELVIKICHDIHADLAEHVHHSTKNLEVSRRLESGPFGHRDLSPFILLRPLRFFDISIDIKAMVTHYLDRYFYNLNTGALFDWATYGEMRSLAQDKYGLVLKEVHLPGQTLEQGLDVLDIMRKLGKFVNEYRYNLNNQIFIEIQSANNTLNAIGVTHIANSIRTHGTGIMNTTVSVAYQYLKEQLHRFSMFLFDEMIKSRLFRELHTFNEQKKENNNTTTNYPFANAKKIQEYVKGLGQTNDKKTYLQKFKELVTKIGNTMGYVRMIRSGGLLFTANSIQFVPDISEIEKFKDLVQEDNLPQEIVNAAHNLDSVIDTLIQNFSEGSEYFKMLVNVFATEYRDLGNSHLQNFYLIIPALTLTFIEQIQEDKEKFKRKGREQGIFTDDGFALGLAYLLKLLNQNKAFESLHWFQSAQAFYTTEYNAKSRDKENVKISHLTKTKLQNDLKELELLRYNFNSARILFHD